MKRENPEAKIFLGIMIIMIVCVFGIGFILGDRSGFKAGAREASSAAEELLQEKTAEISHINYRLTRALDQLQLRIRAETWTALASWYGKESGNVTASGRIFDPNELTAANWHLPFGSVLAVENISDPESPSYGRRVFVWVDDRGPAHWTRRTLDLSRGAAEKLGMIEDGLAMVRVWRLL